MASWNKTFFDSDAQAYESSNSSDSDPSGVDPASEEEVDVGPTIEILADTQLLCERMEGQVIDKVREVLHVMAKLGINLTLFLDAVSWGDPACIADPKVRAA
jgi:hypothetical protein